MLRLVVNSSTVLSIGYEAGAETLEIEFVHANETYHFLRVPLSVYEAFREASSKGRFFNEHIRDHYDSVRIR